MLNAWSVQNPKTVFWKLWKCVILCHICVDYVLIIILFYCSILPSSGVNCYLRWVLRQKTLLFTIIIFMIGSNIEQYWFMQFIYFPFRTNDFYQNTWIWLKCIPLFNSFKVFSTSNTNLPFMCFLTNLVDIGQVVLEGKKIIIRNIYRMTDTQTIDESSIELSAQVSLKYEL